MLGNILHAAKDTWNIIGVQFREVDFHNLHNFYVDDIHLIMKADEHMISTCESLFNSFSLASRLFYDWGKTKAMNLSCGSLPQFLVEKD